MSKKKEERQQSIREILCQQDQIRVVDLAKQLNVTPETLRKDLDEMEQQQLVERQHGFARIKRVHTEMPVEARNLDHPNEKRRIALRAIEEIKDGQVVYISGGSTILAGIQALRTKKDLTLIVNTIYVALECIEMNFPVVFVGGFLHKVGLRTDGYFTEKMLDSFHIDVAILGTDGIKDAEGFTVYTMEEIGTRRRIFNQSKKIIYLADTTKFEKASHFECCKFREVDMLITNPLTPAQRKQVSAIHSVIEV